ncbi:receptor-like cytosolic serine/threonine-protein kinase RBK1 [Senna tora]|uniref:non-specific serine/threonine protein kinase n=1 Tax=Senna tora TaxID=362788 RepID=A0A834STY1_9FABA|nr:receptor-like cytosolic serine/threonine-protein kinase RBK1 [Senna tora]
MESSTTSSNQEREYGCDDEASPRGVLEVRVSGTESDRSCGSSSCSSNYSSAERPPLGNMPQWKGVMDAFRINSVRRLSAIPLFASSYMISKKSLRKLARIRSAEEAIDLSSFPTKPSWKNFPYSDLAAATDDFSPENLIGKGGHAEVYKGRLPDGRIVAVKKLVNEEKDNADNTGDFLTELGIIAHINHPNACHLIGFGIDKGLFFVLHYAPYGSLATLLFDSEKLEWKIRFKVAVGVAEGLMYLHHECPRRIIHRDIKASNILLNDNYEAEVSDFGLAKWLPEKWDHHVVFPIEGTFGYLAPEYFMHGIVDEKTDVFAFGVLLLEIITGRRAVDSDSRQSLVIWAKPLLDTNNVKELVDPRLEDDYDSTEMKRAMATASVCVHHTPSKRPYMNRLFGEVQVAQMLKGEEGSIEMRQKSITPRSLMLEACDLEDYSCSSYLNDLNRHRELIME